MTWCHFVNIFPRISTNSATAKWQLSNSSHEGREPSLAYFIVEWVLNSGLGKRPSELQYLNNCLLGCLAAVPQFFLKAWLWIERGDTFKNCTLHMSNIHSVSIFNIVYKLWQHLVFCKLGHNQLHSFSKCALWHVRAVFQFEFYTLSRIVLCDFKHALYLNFILYLSEWKIESLPINKRRRKIKLD